MSEFDDYIRAFVARTRRIRDRRELTGGLRRMTAREYRAFRRLLQRLDRSARR